jgi:hypothetical protein
VLCLELGLGAWGLGWDPGEVSEFTPGHELGKGGRRSDGIEALLRQEKCLLHHFFFLFGREEMRKGQEDIPLKRGGQTVATTMPVPTFGNHSARRDISALAVSSVTIRQCFILVSPLPLLQTHCCVCSILASPLPLQPQHHLSRWLIFSPTRGSAGVAVRVGAA